MKDPCPSGFTMNIGVSKNQERVLAWTPNGRAPIHGNCLLNRDSRRQTESRASLGTLRSCRAACCRLYVCRVFIILAMPITTDTMAPKTAIVSCTRKNRHIYLYIYTHVYIYTYIVCICMYVYIYILYVLLNMHIYTSQNDMNSSLGPYMTSDCW